MTNEQLAEIEQRLQAASPGPWVDSDSHDGSEGLLQVYYGVEPISSSVCVFCDMEECEGQDLHNAAFVAHAPADIATLIAEVRRLQAERPKLCYQLDHASTAIGYAVEAIDSDDVISAHARLTSAQTIIENADAHKDEWNAYR